MNETFCKPSLAASFLPYSRNASQQSSPTTLLFRPTRRASFMAVSPKPQPISRTLSPSLTGNDGKIASLWWVSPSTKMCLYLMNFGTRISFQKSTYWALCTFASTALTGFPPSVGGFRVDRYQYHAHAFHTIIKNMKILVLINDPLVPNADFTRKKSKSSPDLVFGTHRGFCAASGNGWYHFPCRRVTRAARAAAAIVPNASQVNPTDSLPLTYSPMISRFLDIRIISKMSGTAATPFRTDV